MLILTRKIDQSIIISGNIQIMVLGVERDRVKLGIAAPAEITVLREELVTDDAENAPSPLRRRTLGTNMTPTHGALALKPDED
ncbi:MAG TPA: carbon storage regulator [Dehalococcoidia bacterium]|nr:carbon storage regulator [Dehalococcoidia bacterium]